MVPLIIQFAKNIQHVLQYAAMSVWMIKLMMMMSAICMMTTTTTVMVLIVCKAMTVWYTSMLSIVIGTISIITGICI